MNNGKALLGLLAGVAIGATLGILFAPDKGSKTRKKILEKGEDYVEGLKDQFTGLLDKITSDAKEEEDELNHKAQKAVEKV